MWSSNRTARLLFMVIQGSSMSNAEAVRHSQGLGSDWLPTTYFCCILLVKTSSRGSPDSLWEGTIQGCATRRSGSLGPFLRPETIPSNAHILWLIFLSSPYSCLYSFLTLADRAFHICYLVYDFHILLSGCIQMKYICTFMCIYMHQKDSGKIYS